MLRYEVVRPTKKILEQTIAGLEKFGELLPKEDKPILNDLMDQCRQHLEKSAKIPYLCEEFPLMIAMLFSQYRRVTALEKQVVIKGPESLAPPKKEPENPPNMHEGPVLSA
jgi:hypothetical protein